MLSRSEAESFREQTRALALQIGLRPAARALGLNEERVKKWGQVYKWGIGLIRPCPSGPSNGGLNPQNLPKPLDVLTAVMAQEGDRTRSAMARTARRAFEHCDQLTDDQLHAMDRAIALEKHGRVASIAHQWQNTGAKVAVQVNVPLPSAEERQEMRSMDAKLDAIAAKLK